MCIRDRPQGAPTARAHGAKIPSRIDATLLSRDLFLQCVGFEVGPPDVYDVHSMLSLIQDITARPCARVDSPSTVD
eukprot:5701295-Alexandrium_andersonii.AAC.1